MARHAAPVVAQAPRGATPAVPRWQLPPAAQPAARPQRLACACGGRCPRCAAGGATTRPGDALEADATRRAAAAADLRTPPALGPSGAELPAATRDQYAARLGAPLHGVRVHHDAAAQQRSAALGALAYTQGRDVHLGHGVQARPALGGPVLAHELAHTLQPAVRHGGHVARLTLGDLPLATRRALQVSRTPPDAGNLQQWVTDYFDPTSGTTRQTSLTPDFGADITDAQQRTGLTAVLSELVDLSDPARTPDPEARPLPPNALVDLALDLRPHGGEHAVFRFVRYTEGGTEKQLIEKTQVLAAAGTTTASPAAAAPGTATHTGAVTVGSVRIDIDTRFSADEGQAIAGAVGLLPDLLRARVDGLRFVDAGTGQGPGGENGHYDPAIDGVRIWGAMFDASPRRVGAASATAYQIVHEIGHAVDLRPLHAAERARNAAQEALDRLQRPPTLDLDTSGDPLAGLDDTPRADPARDAEIARLRQEIATHDAAIAAAASVAGHEVGTATESMLTAFAVALVADGVTAVPRAKTRNAAVEAANTAAEEAHAADPSTPEPVPRPLEPLLSGGITRYAATDLMEAYAEHYALYVLDEALLLALRPRVHAYFASAQPKTAPPAATP